jgi:predicted small metal-binding protein
VAELEFRCRDVGLACRKKVKADDEGELVAQIADHAEAKHGVTLNETLIDYARSKVRGGDGE